MNRHLFTILSFFMLIAASCSKKIISNKYYLEHKKSLDNIESSYEKLNAARPFAVAFIDKELSTISLEMISDSLTRIYELDINEPGLADSLLKFKYEATGILSLVKEMQQTKVTWINNFDYYTNDQPKRLIYLSIKPVTFRFPFSPPKYITLAYFRTAQSFDGKGRLLDGRHTDKLRKLNGQVFYKITERICYTIADKYR